VSWLRFRIGMENLAALRSKLTIHISAVNAFVSGLNASTLSRMEPMLERIYLLLDERAKGNLDRAQTVLTAKNEGDEDGASWAILEMDLMTEGIPSEYIQGNKERIKEVLWSVVEMNHLDGDDGIDGDTVYADDSVSQVGRLRLEDEEMRVPKDLVAVNSSQGKSRAPKARKSWFGTLNTVPAPHEKRSGRKVVKPQILPYEEWLKGLSPEQGKDKRAL
jgi:hypothetical protein